MRQNPVLMRILKCELRIRLHRSALTADRHDGCYYTGKLVLRHHQHQSCEARFEGLH